MGDSFPMKGGDGVYSYTKNSQVQKEASDIAKLMIQEAIMQKLELKIWSTVVITDLGCSVGPNTFFTVETMIEAVKEKQGVGLDIEFQVFFNDHSVNDFNTLFASLSMAAGRQYCAAGVPGSFHGRLFPRASISLAHSSFSLHWLSRAPQGLISNKGRIFYAGEARDDVLNAYSEQFESDMRVFMSARAQEIVEGGLMFLILPGIANGVAHTEVPFATPLNLLQSSLTDLAAQGVVDGAKIDSFNLPMYFPSVEEMTNLIEKYGSFNVERIELTSPKLEVTPHIIATHSRAILEGILSDHFGDSVADKIFDKVSTKAQEIPHEQLQAAHRNSTILCFVLKRK